MRHNYPFPGEFDCKKIKEQQVVQITPAVFVLTERELNYTSRGCVNYASCFCPNRTGIELHVKRYCGTTIHFQESSIARKLKNNR
ncbi:hypothetical protein ACROYT_G033267 [Oculina patagonica]